jgi:ubiquinone/menaquinone biosynthesis C-methylase UbiE
VRAFREAMLRLAHLKMGESVLDVGCGTGTLAIAAKRQVGTTGAAYGVHASQEGNDERANDHRHDVHRIDAGQ